MLFTASFFSEPWSFLSSAVAVLWTTFFFLRAVPWGENRCECQKRIRGLNVKHSLIPLCQDFLINVGHCCSFLIISNDFLMCGSSYQHKSLQHVMWIKQHVWFLILHLISSDFYSSCDNTVIISDVNGKFVWFPLWLLSIKWRPCSEKQ